MITTGLTLFESNEPDGSVISIQSGKVYRWSTNSKKEPVFTMLFEIKKYGDLTSLTNLFVFDNYALVHVDGKVEVMVSNHSY